MIQRKTASVRPHQKRPVPFSSPTILSMACRRRLLVPVGLALVALLLYSPSSLSFQPVPHLAKRRTRTSSTTAIIPRTNKYPGGLSHTSSSSSRSTTSQTTTAIAAPWLMATNAPGDGDIPDEEAEWRAVIAAFRMYKAAYGDLKVPQRFVVPNMKPWPVAAHNLRLGKVVANIRATGRYLQNQPARRALLEELGFVWRVRSPTSSSTDVIAWEQVFAALKAFRKLSKSSSEEVPGTFIVPDLPEWPESVRGLPLGQQLAMIRSSVLPINPQAREAFASLGVLAESPDSEDEPDEADKIPVHDLRFQTVYTALQTFLDLYGDLLVPQPFVVPSDSDEWPPETWGLRLGARVNAIRSQGTFVNSNPERRKMLDDLGFVWSPPKSAAYGMRRGRRGKAEMEQNDVEEEEVEEEDEEQADAATSKGLGSFGGAESDDDEAAMDALLEGSFVFDQEPLPMNNNDDSSTPSSWNLEGAHMPSKPIQVVEDSSPVDEYLLEQTLEDSLRIAGQLALELGVIEGQTENKRVIKGKREKEIPWFNDDFGDDFVFEDVVEALTVYKSMYCDFSNLTASDEFVVPAPKEITGFLDDGFEFDFDVDASTRAAAAIANFEANEEFESSEDLIAAEIRRLQDELGESRAAAATKRSTKMPTSITSSTDSWPEHLAGMALGNIVQRIRDGSLEVKHLPERKEQLDALDFDWGDDKYFLDVPFEKAMCAIYAYYLVRGDMFVYEDFVMPDEDPWPQALAGYELGKAVRRLRELQNFLEAYHPEKVGLLRMLDFVWFADTMALPLDPDEAIETSESLLLGALGHPDYAKMIDIPMGLPDKLVADGPFFETDDDPKLWWRKWHNWDYVKDYWYQQGRRDNAYVLRKMGYTQMAEEHEAKYGPGLLSQIDETMQALRGGVNGKTVEEKQELLQKLNYYRQEMLECSDIHPQDRDQLLLDLDTHMIDIMKDTKLPMLEEDELANGDGGEDYEEVDGEDSDEEGEYEEEYVGGEYEEEEYDVENELGLDRQ